MSAAKKVDVLHAMAQADTALYVARLGADDIFRRELNAARVAVAELIAADRDFDIARMEFDAAFQPATHTRQAKAPKHGDPVVARYRAAFARRYAALAHIGGDV